MLSRGFRGEIIVPRRHGLNGYDILFAVIFISLFAFMRVYDIVPFIGEKIGHSIR
jgi:hypothetical protein